MNPAPRRGPMPGAVVHSAIPLLRDGQWVDLTHGFSPTIPHAPAFDPEQRRVVAETQLAADGGLSGFLAHEYRHVGQWGTHVDPPVHFAPALRSQDEIGLREMVLPLCVIDVSAQVIRHADYCVTDADLLAWEAQHGRVPEASFVALRTDWSHRWPSQSLMLNTDENGVRHSPGWSRSVLMSLFEDRGITACGHETLDTDPGSAVSAGNADLERYVLNTNHYQIELLTNLGKVPAAGSIVIATWPKASGGSGFPARVFAIF